MDYKYKMMCITEKREANNFSFLFNDHNNHVKDV